MRCLALVLVVGCGGGTKAAKAPPPPPPVKEAPAEKTAPAEPEPPPPPKVLHAKAALAPMKGVKLAGATVSFAQEDGGETTVSSDDFEGLKPGTYQLVIHDGETCDKPGEPWKGGAWLELPVTITKDTHAMAETKVQLDLGGVAPVVGHALVLHDKKKKPLACGAIEAVGGAGE